MSSLARLPNVEVKKDEAAVLVDSASGTDVQF